MRRHWWWRPGWRLYAWHLTFGDQSLSRGQAELRRLVGGYQAAWPSRRAWTWCRPRGCT
jgi:hypothetical protein